MTLTLLWEITLGSWLTAALILLARLLFGRWLSARGKYLLWLPLLLRLILPFMPPSPTSLMNVLPAQAVELLDSAERTSAGAGENGPAAQAGPAMPERERGGARTLRLPVIWLCGMGAVLLLQGLLYFLSARAMRRMPPCTDPDTRSELLRLRQLTGIDGSLRLAWGSAGMLGGLLDPVLVLPVERRKDSAAPILLHELMHQKSGHLWLGLLLRLLCAVYWFNPLLWLCAWQAKQDCEELCDQMVLDTGLVAPRTYSEVLYTEGLMNGPVSPLPRTSFGGRRGSLCRRIGLIARHSRRGRGESRLLPIVLILCILLCGAAAPLPKGAQLTETVDPVPPGYGSMDAYLQALQPDLGRFGASYPELAASGYFREARDLRYEPGEEDSTLTLRRELYGAERTLVYYFILSPFRGMEEGRQILFRIDVCLTEEELERNFLGELGGEILADWRVLAETSARNRSAAPFNVGDILGDRLCRLAAERAKELRWTADPENYRQRMVGNPIASLNCTRNRDAWVLYGNGLALYENRPGTGEGKGGDPCFDSPVTD